MKRNLPDPQTYPDIAMEPASAARFEHIAAEARTDAELVREVLSGRHPAFAELASRHRGRVERLCRRFFADGEVVRDLAQESFIKAFVGLKSYRLEEPFAGWLRAIVINVCYDELRRRRRRPEDLVADFNGPATSAWLDLVSSATPEQILEAADTRREAHDLAHQLLSTLKAEDQMVLVLKESEEMSVAEIARVMRWSEAKVKIRAFRARQAMRRYAERVLGIRRRRGFDELF
jgi:RNA polymerase sigma-70 factor, ECF subfamily